MMEDHVMQVVAHNLLAQFTNRQLNITSKENGKSAEKLSSGYRINRAADDAAGLSISEKMRRQIRGLNQASDNCQDGISLVQVADGALNETHSILQRMNELAIQSANGTNSSADRAAIDEERKELVSELNRIANTTTFNNDIYPLRGSTQSEAVESVPMKTITYGDVSLDDIKLVGSSTISQDVADTYVGWRPFRVIEDYDSLALHAVIDDKKNEFPTDTYSLIFGDGTTSHSRMRLTEANAYYVGLTSYEQYDVALSDFHYDSGSYNFDEATKTWSRSFSWTSANGNLGAQIVQKVQIDDADKNYIITNEVKSIGAIPAFTELMVNLDTAYNNNDSCEGYYTNGVELTNYTIFNTASTENALFQDWIDPSMSSYVYDDSKYPDSISIVNRDFQDMLPFTEKISFSGAKPVISIGDWSSQSAQWDYFKTTGPAEHLGQNAIGTDRSMTLIWSTGKKLLDVSQANQHRPIVFSFSYGVDSVKKDTNLPATQVKSFKTLQVPDWDAYEQMKNKELNRNETLRIWAGTSSKSENGIYIHMVNATAEALGVSEVDLSSEQGALVAIDQIKGAIEKTSNYRSYFGAVQNRMEHTIRNIDNISENTTSAESRIRDTNMAKEMVNNAKINILSQAGQSMLSQANQIPQGVLSLLQ